MNFPGGGGPHKVENDTRVDWRIGEGGFSMFRTCVDCMPLDFGMWGLMTVGALQI